MDIQYISYKHDRQFESENITCKTFSNPIAFDNFDITVISLQYSELWYNKGGDTSHVDCIKDLHNLGEMSFASSRSRILFLLPQDYSFHSLFSHNSYHNSIPIRKILSNVSSLISESLGISGIALAPGEEITQLAHEEYKSAFSISVQEPIDENCVLRGNGNCITVYKTDDYAATTIQVNDFNSLLILLEGIGFICMKSIDYPDWLDTIPFLDELDLRARLESKKAKIIELNDECTQIENKLAKYRDKKLILCTKDSELQDNIVSMLEEMFPREEPFVDVSEEDYRFETENRAFLFEVKGSEKSLKRSHISKTDNHVQIYKDSYCENQEAREAKGILIFSEEIEKPPSEHLPYVGTQMELAEKYGILVIPASEFLRLYERFRRAEIVTDQILEKLWSKTGLWSDEGL